MTTCHKATQVVHCVVIALLIVPNTMFYASANVISAELVDRFGFSAIASLAFQLVTIPSIFSTVFFSFIIDAFQYRYVFPALQATLVVGSVFSVLSFVVGGAQTAQQAVHPAIQVLGSSMFYITPRYINLGQFLSDLNEARAFFNEKSASGSKNTTGVAFYLLSRAVYGLAGESTLAAQAKLISAVIDPPLRVMAFALAFCGYMAGEALSGAVFPRVAPEVGYCIVFALQMASLCGISVYSCIARRGDGAPLKIQMRAALRAFKYISADYWLIAAFRILYHSAKSAWDARSVRALASIYGGEAAQTRAQAAQVAYTGASAAFFLLSGLAGIFIYQKAIILAVGVVLTLTALFCAFAAAAAPLLPALMLGAGYGLFSATCSSILVQCAGERLASSALGVVFSAQFVIVSVLIYIAESIARSVGERWNAFLDAAIVIFGACFWAAQGVIVLVKKRRSDLAARIEQAPGEYADVNSSGVVACAQTDNAQVRGADGENVLAQGAEHKGRWFGKRSTSVVRNSRSFAGQPPAASGSTVLLAQSCEESHRSGSMLLSRNGTSVVAAFAPLGVAALFNDSASFGSPPTSPPSSSALSPRSRDARQKHAAESSMSAIPKYGDVQKPPKTPKRQRVRKAYNTALDAERNASYCAEDILASPRSVAIGEESAEAESQSVAFPQFALCLDVAAHCESEESAAVAQPEDAPQSNLHTDLQSTPNDGDC